MAISEKIRNLSRAMQNHFNSWGSRETEENLKRATTAQLLVIGNAICHQGVIRKKAVERAQEIINQRIDTEPGLELRKLNQVPEQTNN